MSREPTLSDIERRIASASAERRVPLIDLSKRDFGLADLAGYQRTGVLVVRGLVSARELQFLDQAARRLIQRSWDSPGERDFVSATFDGQPQAIPYKIDYILDKDPALRVLAGHPRLLAIVAAIAGPGFIPTWETLVFKDQLAGPRLPWHRDCALYQSPVAVGGLGRLVDAGIYLDPSTPDNGLHCLPGSCYWPDDVAAAAISVLNAEWDSYPGVAVVVEPGDVVLHNILTLHSAPGVRGQERRVIYYEYRPAELEIELGPHSSQYVAEKQRVLRDCLAERKAASLVPAEPAFSYDPPAELRRWPRAKPNAGFRISHSDYWTWAHVDPEPR
jgi:phytanoyl-CoA hydroxylase